MTDSEFESDEYELDDPHDEDYVPQIDLDNVERMLKMLY